MSRFCIEHYDPLLHLFTDDDELRQVWAVHRSLGRVHHSPEPIMTPGGPDAPWESEMTFCPYAGSVVVDPQSGRLRLYYFLFGDMARFRPGDYPRMMAMCLAESADGVHWSEPVRVKDGGDTFGCAWDPRRELWMWADRMEPEANSFGHYVRLIEMYESPDLREWTRQGRAMVLGPECGFGLTYQLWGMQPFTYGDAYLGFIGLSNAQAPTFNLGLASSRDGRRFALPFGPEPFLRVGAPGNWNGELLNVTLNPPVRDGDRLLIYYTARNSDRLGRGRADNYLGVATMPIDRFVAMGAAETPGYILTEPVLVGGPQLYVNMQNTHGTLQVEVRDEQNRPIPGYAVEDCARLQERGTRVRVEWKEKQDLRELVGRRCALKFCLRHATIYSYRFGE